MYDWQQQQLCKQLGLMDAFRCAMAALLLSRRVEICMQTIIDIIRFVAEHCGRVAGTCHFI